MFGELEGSASSLCLLAATRVAFAEWDGRVTGGDHTIRNIHVPNREVTPTLTRETAMRLSSKSLDMYEYKERPYLQADI